MEKYNTIDLDLNSKFLFLNLGYVEPIEFYIMILNKISKCKCGKILKVSPSDNKGLHIRLICEKDCDICRLVFDHQKRYVADLTRREQFSNLMFDVKVPLR